MNVFQFILRHLKEPCQPKVTAWRVRCRGKETRAFSKTFKGPQRGLIDSPFCDEVVPRAVKSGLSKSAPFSPFRSSSLLFDVTSTRQTHRSPACRSEHVRRRCRMRGATSLGGEWRFANAVAAYNSSANCFRNATISVTTAQPLIVNCFSWLAVYCYELG